MKVEKHDIIVETQEQFQIIDITSKVEKILSSANTENGILSFWVPHTTACISINENDPELWMDILQSFKKLVPVKCDYEHGKNAYAHILSSLIKPNLQIPIIEGDIPLGRWQKILFIELDGPRKRTIHAALMG